MIDFEGSLVLMDGGLGHSPILGRYEWLDQLTPEPRVRGVILCRHAPGRDGLGGTDPRMLDGRGVDLHDAFDQSIFLGRACRLSIPGVGVSPVRIRSSGRWDDVRFEAWAPAIPDVTLREVVDGLWTPAHDALYESGHPELAGLVRAACVLIEGFGPDPARSKARK